MSFILNYSYHRHVNSRQSRASSFGQCPQSDREREKKSFMRVPLSMAEILVDLRLLRHVPCLSHARNESRFASSIVSTDRRDSVTSKASVSCGHHGEPSQPCHSQDQFLILTQSASFPQLIFLLSLSLSVYFTISVSVSLSPITSLSIRW